MRAEFQETIAKLKEELITTKLRVEEEANRIVREKEAAETKKREADRRGSAVSAMGSMWSRGVSTGADLEQGLPHVSRGIIPRHPVECSPSEYIDWEQRFKASIADQGLRHTISPDALEIAVISCTNNAYLFGQFGEDLVTDHRLVWWYISEATADTAFEDRLYECHSISDALRIMREWSLPLYPAERHLLVAELERVQFMGDEESEIVQFILHQFPERPSNPHALVVGRGFRDGGGVGVGVQRSDDHMVSRGGGRPWQQQQPQQHWSRGVGMPQQQKLQQHWSRGDGMPRQQQQPQQHWSRGVGMPQQQKLQQHWPRGGGMPRQQQQPQQQWSHGGGMPWQQQQQQQRSRGGGIHQHQRSFHVFPPTRQAQQQQPLEEWRRSENMEMSMFSLSEGSRQSEPTAVAFATTAPAAETVTGTSVFPAVTSKGMTKTPTSSMGVASAAVPAAEPTTGGTVFPDASEERADRQLTLDESSAGTASSDAVAEAAPLTGDTVISDASVERADGQLTLNESSAGTASSDAVAEAAPLTGDTVFPDASVERVDGQLTLEESSAGTAASDAVAEATSLTGDTAAPDASVERVAGKLTLKAGSSSEICGERGASTHPFDPGTMFPLEVRYANSSSSSSSKSKSSSSSSSNHKDVAYVGTLLRPFDPGKRCHRGARIEKAVCSLDLSFDRGKTWRRMQHGG